MSPEYPAEIGIVSPEYLSVPGIPVPGIPMTDRFIYDFPKKLHAKIMKILLEDKVPILNRRPDLPAGLAAIIHRGLARDPQARYANVREMHRALLPFAM